MKRYISGMFLTVFMLLVLLPVRAEAASIDEVLLDSQGTVTIRSQHAAKEGVSSLQFSLSVESANAEQVKFDFDASNAKISEFRYDKESGKLNIYMAGADALFSENTNSLTVGKIVALDSNGETAVASVSVDSLKYVYGTEASEMGDEGLPKAVQIGTGGNPEPGQPTQQPQGTQEPVQPTQQPSGTQEPVQPTQQPSGTQEPVQPTQQPS
ncbi:MAG TPA: hypothetical protein DCZ91_09350, partial [Lachnospiraceae bacterium]|nr:hypothetical protein [Lachnospiraceae bacterium]